MRRKIWELSPILCTTLENTKGFYRDRRYKQGIIQSQPSHKITCFTTMTEQAASNSYKHSLDSECIKDQTRIVRLLEQLARRNTALTVQIPNHKGLYTSCTVAVDKPYVLLDELMPSNGHPLLLKERTLKISCKLDGVDIGFIASLKRVEERDNLLTYYMSLPKQLEYRQRRQDYRIHIPISKTLQVIMDNGDDAVNEGALHDISHGGTGMIFPVTYITVEPGHMVECAIELPGKIWLYCSVELRYSKKVRSQQRQLIGARYNDLTPAQTRLIGRCISELEREYMRKRATYE